MIPQKFKQTEIGKIPEDWEEKPLSEIVEIIGGGTPKTDIKEYWGGEIPWLSINDFNNNSRFVSRTEKTITKQGLRNSSTKILKKGMLIISARGTVGEIAQLTKDMAFNQSCYGLNAKNGYINDFLYYLIKYYIIKLKSHSYGSVFDTITTKTFDNLDVFSPKNISEQFSIASILSSLDAKIELNNKMNKTLETIGQAIFKKWFIDGRKEEWKEGFLGDNNLTEILGSGIEEFQGEKIYIATADVDNSKIIDYNTKITFEERQSRANMQPIQNSIWFAKMKDSKKVFLIDNSKDFEIKNIIFSTGFTGLKVKPEALYYIWNFVNKDSFEEAKDNLSIGTTMQGVNNDLIMKMNIIIPDKETLRRFNDAVRGIYSRIYNNNKQNQTLSSIRDALLPKLMSGEIRVK